MLPQISFMSWRDLRLTFFKLNVAVLYILVKFIVLFFYYYYFVYSQAYHSRYMMVTVNFMFTQACHCLIYKKNKQQNCSHKIWHISIKIFSNGSSKISLVFLLRKSLFLFLCCGGIVIFRLGMKNCIMKNEK